MTNRFDHRVFVIDKAPGPTSFEIVSAMRRVTGLRKVGHAGTLDPLARGVLLVCTGLATRAVEHFMDLEKEYHFDIRLGLQQQAHAGAHNGVVVGQEDPERCHLAALLDGQ